jgi:molecular chaperone IbpA
VGFDHAFERFNTQLEHTQGSNFPPYNIKKLDSFNWTIEMALAGFNKKDIEVLYSDNQLTIKSIFEKDDKEEDTTTIHRGISKRQFKKAFTLSDEVVVNGAELKDGMLIVDLEKIVPEEKKPRTIKIS